MEFIQPGGTLLNYSLNIQTSNTTFPEIPLLLLKKPGFYNCIRSPALTAKDGRVQFLKNFVRSNKLFCCSQNYRTFSIYLVRFLTERSFRKFVRSKNRSFSKKKHDCFFEHLFEKIVCSPKKLSSCKFCSKKSFVQ